MGRNGCSADKWAHGILHPSHVALRLHALQLQLSANPPPWLLALALEATWWGFRHRSLLPLRLSPKTFFCCCPEAHPCLLALEQELLSVVPCCAPFPPRPSLPIAVSCPWKGQETVAMAKLEEVDPRSLHLLLAQMPRPIASSCWGFDLAFDYHVQILSLKFSNMD